MIGTYCIQRVYARRTARAGSVNIVYRLQYRQGDDHPDNTQDHHYWLSVPEVLGLELNYGGAMHRKLSSCSVNRLG